MWFIGALIEDQVDSVQSWIGGNRIWLLGLSVIAVAWTLFGEFRGDNGELAHLRSLTNDDGTDGNDTETTGPAEESDVAADGGG